MRGLVRAALVALALAGPLPAQEPQVQSPVLTVDLDRLYGETQFGQRLRDDILAESQLLEAENDRILRALTEEERGLTEARATMDPAAFRAAADEFDRRVQGIRNAQDAKERDLQSRLDQSRDQFLQSAAPVLGQIMRDSGAAVILDRRTVFLAVAAVDVTDLAIAAIDREIGQGPTEAPATPEALPE